MSLDPKKVDDLVREYETTYALELERLKTMARELSAQFYWYSKILGEVSQHYQYARAKRKRILASLVAKYKAEENSNAAAVARAENTEDYRQAYDEEYGLQGREKSGGRQCDAIKKVLERMGQDIADLRKQQEYERFAERVK